MTKPTKEAFVAAGVKAYADLLYLEPFPRIAFLGNNNVGKSTLLNAILGFRHLPADVIPTTSTAIRIVHGEILKTIVQLNESDCLIESGTDLLQRFAVKESDEKGQARDITVEIPAFLLEPRMTLVDLPGLENDVKDYDTVFREVFLADLVVSVHDTRNQVGRSEQDLIRIFVESECNSITFVLNWTNSIESKSRSKAIENASIRFKDLHADPILPMRRWYRIDAEPALNGQGGAFLETFLEDLACLKGAWSEIAASRSRKLQMILDEAPADERVKLASFSLPASAPDPANADSLRELGKHYLNGTMVTKNFRTALHLFLSAAELGDLASLHHLGVIYDLGLGEDSNRDRARYYYSRAASLGSAESMNNLGTLFDPEDNADGVAETAISWYSKAADHGSQIAMCNLGDLLRKDNKNVSDIEEALNWYRKAAKCGSHRAMEALGDMYRYGIEGVIKIDLVEARRWYIESRNSNQN